MGADIATLLLDADLVLANGDARDLDSPAPLPAGIDYANQNRAYFGTPDGPINAETVGSFESIAAVNGGGSGALPSPPQLNPGAGLFLRSGNMANVRASFEFLGVDGENWSEEWWTPQSGVAGSLPTPSAIITTRLGLLSASHKLVRVRYVQDDASRLTALEDVFRQGTQTVPAAGMSPADLALVLNVKCVNGKVRRWWLRGVNDADWAIDAAGHHVLNAPTNMPARVGAFVNALFINGWGSRFLQQVALRPPNVTFISNVNGSGVFAGQALISTVAPHGLALGDEVIVYRTSVKDLPSLRGHWRVTAVPTATSFQLPYRTPLDSGPVAAGGFVRKAVYAGVSGVVAAAVNAVPPQPRLLHVAHHSTKEGVFGSRGARRAARSRQSP